MVTPKEVKATRASSAGSKSGVRSWMNQISSLKDSDEEQELKSARMQQLRKWCSSLKSDEAVGRWSGKFETSGKARCERDLRGLLCKAR
jgi:hypothetical protein